MILDYSPVRAGTMRIADLATTVNRHDLPAATTASIDYVRDLIAGLTDQDATFIARDPEAEGEIGWNIAHLVVHVTAGSEEGAAVGSVLARGIPYPFEPRLRYETPWESVTTVQQCLSRLEESRRMRLSYLQTWPDVPTMDTFRGFPPPLLERFGKLNAVGAVVLGLSHEQSHFAQFQEVIRQAKAYPAP